MSGTKPRDIPNNRSIYESIGEVRRPAALQDSGWIEVVPNWKQGSLPEGDPGSEAGGVTPIWKNNWTNVATNSGSVYPIAGFHIEGSEVRFRGHFRGGTPGTVAFVLPVMYRPEKNETFLVPNDAGGYVTLEIIAATGEVLVVSVSL